MSTKFKQSARFASSIGRRRRWASLAIVVAVVAAFGLLTANAAIKGGFELDASTLDPNAAMLAQTDVDWADSSGGTGIFAGVVANSTAVPETPAMVPYDLVAEDCYGSDIYENPLAGQVNVFICDGNADAKFGTGGGAIITEVEQSVVSPSGKQAREHLARYPR